MTCDVYCDGVARPIDRRTFLTGTALAALAACASKTSSDQSTTSAATSPSTTTATTTPAPLTTTVPATTTTVPTPTTTFPGIGFKQNPFTLGVASGDPTSDSVILWTRCPNGSETFDFPLGVPLAWEIATDTEFTKDHQAENVTATPEDGFSVHVEVKGLKPDTLYYYRFVAPGHKSVIGRTRTFPKADAVPDKLRFGFGSCQHYQEGFYTAHKDVAAAELDFFAFLGDYIYEDAGRPVGTVPGPSGLTYSLVRPLDGPQPTTLETYRDRYAIYKSDENLQAAHASCPWLMIWDDHEVQDNYAGDHSKDPALSVADFRIRRAAAYKVWWENVPTRLPKPTGADYRIYRQVAYGALANIFLLDGRQYRSDQACGDIQLSLDPACPENALPERTMLGTEQETWLIDGLGASKTKWNIIANQVVMTDVTINGAVLNYDQWDGYPVARRKLLTAIADRNLTNVVVVTGDIHLAGAGDLAVTDEGGHKIVASELVGTSISSGALVPESIEALVSTFPDLHYLRTTYRGWNLNEVTPTSWTSQYRIVEDALVADSAVRTDATFTMVPTKPGITRV